MTSNNTNESHPVNPRASDQQDPGRQGDRLQKVLASAGVASRRRSEELIVAGRVRVDGEVVTELGTRVNPRRARIEVDGKPVVLDLPRYLMLNKPSGYITTMSDERGRRTVMDLIDIQQRVVPVGRLDRQTEGLLIFTNDGALANKIMHPSNEIEKVYEAVLDGAPPPAVLDEIRRGITVEGSRTIPTFVRPIRQAEAGTVVQIGLHEGRNRIVRRIFDTVNYPVVKLTRIRIGPIQLGTLPRGTWRDLSDGELEQLRDAVGFVEAPPRPSPRIGGASRGRDQRDRRHYDRNQRDRRNPRQQRRPGRPPQRRRDSS